MTGKLKALLPEPVRSSLKHTVRGLRFMALNWPVDRRRLRVRHGGGLPGVGGPAVKLWRMQRYFPDTPRRYNIIYTVSGSVSEVECRWARRLGIPVVCHVNSCWHPAYAQDWQWRNRKFVNIHNELADFIVYGSQQARVGANRYLGPTTAPYEIIYNAVDTAHFQPGPAPDPARFNVLVIGLHSLPHRIEPVIRAMPYIQRHYPQVRLIVAGRLVSAQESLARFTRLMSQARFDAVEFTGQYTQAEAPAIYAGGDVMVHLKHMDWTPNTVIEGMACGLPVVHTGNGGLPELVGQAGLSLGLPADWDKIHTPAPEKLAETIVRAYEKRAALGEAARKMAVSRYDIESWLARHRAIFEELVQL